MADDKIFSLLAGENACRAAEGRARRGTDGGGERETALERPAFHEPTDEAGRKGVPRSGAVHHLDPRRTQFRPDFAGGHQGTGGASRDNYRARSGGQENFSLLAGLFGS